MNRPPNYRLLTVTMIAVCAAIPGLTQEAPAAGNAPQTSADGEVVVLTPFEVTAKTDTGYLATSTLAGTRIRTDLQDVGSAISVLTKDFLIDIGATDNSTLLQYTTNAEVAGSRGTYTGLGTGPGVIESATLIAPATANRVRGLATADNTRDFFVTDIPWDGYNVDRIDIQRGPNSILFGLGSPAGIVNASLQGASFHDSGNLEYRTGSYGSQRASFTANHQLIENVLAIRVAGLWDHEQFKQEPAYENDERFYATVRFDPKFFKDPTFRTSFRMKYEHGDIEANRPRIVPPNDSITPWFRAVDATSLNGGMGKLSVDNPYQVGSTPAIFSPWVISDGIANQQQPIWFIDGTTNQLQRIYGGYVNTGARNAAGGVLGTGSSLVNQQYSSMFFGLNTLSQYAVNANLQNSVYGQYRTASLTDASVFDFYNQLIDGPTKSEFERWDAYNIDFTQTAFGDRLGVQLSYDRQNYERGGEALLGATNTNPSLNIDIMRNGQDLNANPNYGRPYVSSSQGGIGSSYSSDRDYLRAAIFGEIRAKDFLANDSFLGKLLGRHRLNAAYSSEELAIENRAWRMYDHTREWDAYWNRTTGAKNEGRFPVTVMYLGRSLANDASASGANIPGISAPVTLADGALYYSDLSWRNNPGVDFSDPWTVPANLVALFNPTLPLPTTQASNPANYVGWNSNRQINLARYDGGNDLSLLTGAAKTLRKTNSYAVSWQGYLWNDAIVATLGWRSDEVRSKGVTAQPITNNRNALDLAPDEASKSGYNFWSDYTTPAGSNKTGSIFKDESTAGGVVVHLNKLFKKDPLPINVSLSYNKSSNFQVTDTRRDIYGKVISNPTGETKDYGVLLSTKGGKYSLRALKYETTVANATTDLNVTNLTTVIRNGLNWRNVILYQLNSYTWDTRETVANRNNWLPTYVDATGRTVAPGAAVNPPTGSTLQSQAESDAMRDATIRGWNEIQNWLDGKGYFNAWNYTPTTPSALTDRSTYAATLVGNNPAAQYQPDPDSVINYTSRPAMQGFAATADTQSEGYEFEFTANPLPNWRVSFNAAKTTAVRTNVGGPEIAELYTFLSEKLAGPAGDLRLYNASFDSPLNVMWRSTDWSNFRGNYILMKLQENATASELRKWRYNLVTNYSFTGGFLKGVGIGGAYRWQDKVVIGYPLIAKSVTDFSFDLTQPYYGPAEDGVDLWASYERQLTSKINWKIQLNIRNAFANSGVIPVSVQPDGKTWATVRVKPSQEWFLTNTLSF